MVPETLFVQGHDKVYLSYFDALNAYVDLEITTLKNYEQFILLFTIWVDQELWT